MRVFYEVVYHNERDNDILHHHEMLFAFNDMVNFNQTISQWMQVNDVLKTVCNLFFGMQYGPARYLDSRFLVAAQAAEMYHRLRYENRILPADEHKQRTRIVLRRTPKKYSRWMKEQLAFSNEPRLLQRIQDLLALTEDIMLPIVKDGALFATKVKNTRNYYTHYSESVKRKAAVGRELYWVNEALFFLLQRCFLHELGFSSEQCITLFRRSNRYVRAVNQAKFSWGVVRLIRASP